MQIQARRYDSGQPVELTTGDGRIATLEPCAERAELPWVAPGLFDLQVNGHGGQDFSDPALTVEKVERVCRAMDRDGLTGFLATCTTHSFQTLAHVLSTIADAHRSSPLAASRIAGVHLEGPYISPHDGPRGAHPLQHCREPDWDEFQRLQDAAAGLIRLVTLSPEFHGSIAFIEKVVATGVVAAIGHASATSDQIRAAVDAGARLGTHLGNGSHAQLPRHPNYIWDQLAEDRLMISLIVDGFHLPPAVVKSFVRAKGPERCVLISDITALGGMPPGRYERPGAGAVEVLADGKMVVAGQRTILAGAALPLTHAVANVMRFAQVDLKTAIQMATIQPAGLIRLPRVDLQPGSPADLVLLDLPRQAGPLRVIATIKAGQRVFANAPTPQ